jgi:protein TonB
LLEETPPPPLLTPEPEPPYVPDEPENEPDEPRNPPDEEEEPRSEPLPPIKELDDPPNEPLEPKLLLPKLLPRLPLLPKPTELEPREPDVVERLEPEDPDMDWACAVAAQASSAAPTIPKTPMR